MKTILIILAVLAVLAIAGVAWAKKSGYCAGEHFADRVTDRVSRKLELNETQRANLEALAETLKQMRTGWRERRSGIAQELESLLAAPVLDRAKATEILDARHQAMGERKRELVEAFADFSDSLRPEQRKRLAELVAERMSHRWGRFGWAH